MLEYSGPWLTSVPKLELDLFEYLINPRRISITASRILSKYGSQNSPDNGVDQKVLSSENLSDRQDPFLKCAKASIYDKWTGSPIIEAVQRQMAFVDKMDEQLWIRSPALEGTLHRAIDRYLKLLKLLRLYPDTMLVPTLDIDLVWHTYQCSAAQYRSATQVYAGRFINHDDKLGRHLLDNGMEKTRQLFRTRFGEEYLLCNCWDCETVLSAVSASDQKDTETVVNEVLMDVAYHRAVELARRARKPLPVRDG